MDAFYWRHARDSLLTTSALQLFQLVAAKEGEVFDNVKNTIDDEYRVATGSTAVARHGGIVQTQFQVFREAGWATLKKVPAGEIIEITPAGKQALLILTKVPDFIKAAPHFIVELLTRFQLNNPARPESRRGTADYEAAFAQSTIFPYWTLFKVMRSLDNYITSNELRRFVFKIHKQADIDTVIENIKKYRIALAAGAANEALDVAFGKEIVGASGEPKYLMARLGTHVGVTPPLVEKDGPSKWVLNKYYCPFIDEILANEPQFKDVLTTETWMLDYGRPIELEKSEVSILTSGLDLELFEDLPVDLPDDDKVFAAVKELIDEGSRAILFSGPPGTSKTWYARKIAGRLVDGDGAKVRFIQFHPSLSYDDFVEGYVPNADGQNTSFKIVDKIFLKLCKVAISAKPSLCVLVIDEVNRGDIARILGELLTYIEPGYREKGFQLSYSGRTVTVPSNLLILGTFNPFDKSVVELDDAIDRRFDRISLEPAPDILYALLAAEGRDAAMIAKLVKFFVEVNKLMRHGIGHALFLSVKDDATLRLLWKRKLQFVFEKAFRFEPELLITTKQKYLEVFAQPDTAGI